MSAQELLALMAAGRARLLAAIDGLSPEEMVQPGAAGDWSVKDVLAHIAAWQSRLVRLLFQLSRNQKPQSDGRDVDTINAEIYAQQKDRALDLVLADFHGVYEQVRLRVAALDDQALGRRIGPATLEEIIRSDTDEHDDEHAAQLAAWRQAMGAQPGG